MNVNEELNMGVWRAAILVVAVFGAGGCSTADVGDMLHKTAKGALRSACDSLGNCSNVCPDGTEARSPAYSCGPGERRPDIDRPKGL